MPRFFFDHRDGDIFIEDDQGLEFDNLDEARDEAAEALAEVAREVLPGSQRREIAIEVSDEHRNPVLRASLWFNVQKLAPELP